MTGQRTLRRCASGLAAFSSLAALAMASMASAQTPANQAPGQPDTDEDDGAQVVIVTGTRIVRDGYEATTPLTVLSQDEIQNQSPTNNIADFVNQMPSMAGSIRPSNSRLSLSSGLAGINALNLRNLGANRTLVLLDGKRSVSSSSTGLVDINTFPQSLISSVEVVTGGASAAYGSDAVAGVVNFVLDRRYEGLRLLADNGISSEGDGHNYSASLAGGTSFSDGRGHVLLSGEHAHRDGIFQLRRDWNAIGYRTIDNPDHTPDNGLPQRLVREGVGNWNVQPGGMITASTAVPGSGVGANSLRGLYFGQGGSVNEFNFGSITTNALTLGGDWQLSDLVRNLGLDAEESRYGAFGRVSYEIAPWIEVFAQASYNWQRTTFNAGPQLSTAGPSATFTADNAFLINALGAERLAGINTVTIGTSSLDMPYRESNNRRETQRYTIGAEGSFALFGSDAVWDAYAQYGQTDTREQLRQIMITSRINQAVDAVFAPAGNAMGVPEGTIVCRSTLSDPGNGCLPLNRFGVGVADPNAVDWVLGDPYRDQTLKQTVVGANLSFTPFETWAGDVSLAVGGEYRKEEVSGFVPEEFQTGYSVGNFLPSFGSYNVKEAYLEALVPLGFGLDLNGAVRATDYSISGYVTTWKAGATWQPIPDIRLRATQSRDIRAPNLNELFQAGTSRTNTLRDPFDDRVGVTFRENTTGNLNLTPEKADSTSVGVVLQPQFVPGFSFSADWFKIKVEDAIEQLFAQDIINRCFEGREEFCAAYGPDPTGDRELLFNASPFNFAEIKVQGIDFDASYIVPLDGLIGSDSNFTLRGLATRYIDRIVDTGVPEVIPIDSVGSLGGSGPPKWIYRASATFETPTFTITGVGRGVGSGTQSNALIECQTDCPAPTPQNPTVDSNHIPGKFYADLNLTARVGTAGISPDGEAQLFFNITNLFDRDPILLPETGAGISANTTYGDLLGRAFRIGIRLQTR